MVENPFQQIRHSVETESTAGGALITEEDSSRPTGCHLVLRSQGGVEVGTDLGGRGEPAASLVTEHGQPVHEQRVTDQVDLLA